MKWNVALDDLYNMPMNGALSIAVQLFILMGAVFLAWVVHAVLLRLLRRIQYPGFSSFAAYLLPAIDHSTKWMLTLCFLELAWPFTTLFMTWQSRLHHLLYIFIILSMGWVLTGVTMAVSKWLKERYRWQDAKDNLKFRSINTQLRVFTHVLIFIIWLLTLIAIVMTIPHLRTLGVSLFASAGVAGIVIGMAAGPTLSNLIAGIQLALTQPIRIDDQIVIEGVSGVVEEIDSTYVVVRLWDYRRLIVPLNYFIQNRFQNWTHTTSASIIGTVKLYIDQTVSIEPLRKELLSIAKDTPQWDGKICRLLVSDQKDTKIVELQASISTSDPTGIFMLQCDIREKLLRFMQAGKAGA